MSKASRRKGAAYEREVLAEFSAALGETFTRILGQARDGGADGKVYALRLEMKRRSALAQWYAQAAKAAQADEIPLVVLREDRGSSLVLLTLDNLLKLVTMIPSFQSKASEPPRGRPA